MKERIKRQKRKILLNVISVLLAAWALVSVAFCLVVIRLEVNSQFNEEKYNEKRIISVLDDEYAELFYNNVELARKNSLLASELINDNYLGEYNTDIQIVALPGCEYELYFDTDTAICASFSGVVEKEYDETFPGLLNYEDFRNSMTDSQYASIKDYLSIKPNNNGESYHLICTEFYFDGINLRLLPKTVNVVFTTDDNTWYISSSVVQSYTLYPEVTENNLLFKMDTDHCNTIPKEFVLNQFGSGGLIENADEPVSFEDENERLITLDNPKVERLSLFTYVYKNISEITIIGDQGIMTDSSGEEVYYEEIHDVFIKYAKRINVFDECKDFLILGLAGILGFFISLGVVMSVMLLKVMKTQLREEQKRREVTNALAHDIKTPLFIISGYAQNLKENLNTDKHEHYADRIIERSKEVNELVHKMLDFAKLDVLDITLVREDLDFVELVEDVLSDYTDLSDNKSVKLSVISSSSLNADRSLMIRAITNLTENAVRYSDVQTVISVEITEKSFSISNVASSITEDDIKHLTEPYYRGEKNRKSKGNGLGLSTVKSIAEMHGFRLDIRLDGSVIIFTIYFN